MPPSDYYNFVRVERLFSSDHMDVLDEGGGMQGIGGEGERRLGAKLSARP